MPDIVSGNFACSSLRMFIVGAYFASHMPLVTCYHQITSIFLAGFLLLYHFFAVKFFMASLVHGAEIF